jgi:hypothetical protein
MNTTNFQMGALLELDMQNPVDKAVAELVRLGLVECCYHDETGELGVMLTDRAEKMLAEEAELDEYVEGNEFQTFLNKAEKLLDKLSV